MNRDAGRLGSRSTTRRLLASHPRILARFKSVLITVVVTALVFLLSGQEILRIASSPARAVVMVSSSTIVSGDRCTSGAWDTSASGAVQSVGGCPLFGDLSGHTLNKPIVGMAGTSNDGGYWLVASDGGVFSFGDAQFYGSTGGMTLNRPIVGMASTPDGGGYWLVASDGGIFAFGDAQFYGSTGGMTLNRPIVGMASNPGGGGYWLVASDGGIFAFGDAPFYGSSANAPGYQAAAIVALPSGYEIVSTGGAWSQFSPPPATPSSTPSTPSTPSQSTHRPAGDNAPIPHIVGDALETSTGKPLRLLGFDADGTDNACTMDLGFSWGSDTITEADEIAAWHTDAVRVPINEDCWLGINGVPAQYSGQAYRTAIVQWVTALNAAGLVAIIDLHLAAPGTIEATAQWPMADEDHAPTVWQQLAKTFAADPSVIFDLFNEPFLGTGNPTTADWQCWEHGCSTLFDTCVTDPGDPCQQVQYETAGMQQLVTTVRNAGANQPIMLAGLNFATDLCAPIAGQAVGAPCAWSSYEPVDPDHQLMASFHVYDWTACSNLACWNSEIAPMTSIVPVVTGEFGESDCSAQFMDSYMAWADSHNVSYLAWSWSAPNQPAPSSCTASANGHNTDVNLNLLSNWNGTPSTLNPQGPAFAAHLAALAAG
jgi:endoglucanase